MYNITHARRPTDRRPEANARGRTPGGPPDACARGAREARGHWLIGGVAKVLGRVGFVDLPTRLGAPRTTSHERRARELRSSLRCVWTQTQATKAASTVSAATIAPGGPLRHEPYLRVPLYFAYGVLPHASFAPTPQTVTHVAGLFRHPCTRLHHGLDAFFPTLPGQS